jgi:hypothetical protein
MLHLEIQDLVEPPIGISDYRFPIKKILLLASSTTCIILIPLIRDTLYTGL